MNIMYLVSFYEAFIDFLLYDILFLSLPIKYTGKDYLLNVSVGYSV